MAPTLFSMMFSAMLMDAFQNSKTGCPVRYRFDGNIVNLRRLQPKTQVQTDVLDELLLYAENLSLRRAENLSLRRTPTKIVHLKILPR